MVYSAKFPRRAAVARSRARWLLGTSLVTLVALVVALPAKAQTVVDYDAGANGTDPLVLTEDTVLHRNFQNTGAAQQSGPISGAFNLRKTGWGYLWLSGDNSGYSGTTTLAEGGLILDHDNALGSGALEMRGGTVLFGSGTRTIDNAVVLADPSRVIINANLNRLTMNGVISGVGTLQKEGSDALVLNGDNTYSGGTILNNGTIVANSDLALGSGDLQLYSAGNLRIGSGVSIDNNVELTGIGSNNADLTVASEDVGRLMGNISERSAGLGYNKLGGGVLELYGNNSHTGLTRVSEGTLIAVSAGALSQLSDVQIDEGAQLELQHASNLAGLFGEGTLDTTSHLATLGYDNGNAAFDGEVLGSGVVAKRGSGTQIFDGDSQYFNGQAYAEVGSLIINGDWGNADGFVLEGATLGGRGTLHSVASSGTIAPGSMPGDIGTLSTTGRIDMDATSVLSVDVNAQGEGDLLAAGTSAFLAGTVDVRAAGGDYAPSTRYRIVTAAEGIDGTFASVTTDLAFLRPDLTYDANDVWLHLARNERSFIDLEGLTFNQRAVAPVAENLGSGNAIYDALIAQTEEGARAGFDSLSGEIHASQGTILVQDGHLLRDTLLQRMRSPAQGVLSDLDTQSAADDTVPADEWTTGIWSAGLGSFRQIEGDGNASRVVSGTGGALFGFEADHVGGAKLGIAGGFTRTHFDTLVGPGSADLGTFNLGVYGATEIEALALRGGASLAAGTINTSRQVTIGGFSDSLTAAYATRSVQVFGEVGYQLDVGGTTVEPFVGLSHLAVGADGFTEAGGVAALTGAASSYGSTNMTVGLRGERDLHVSDEGTLTASAGVAWQHAFDGGAPQRDLRFASGTGPFTIAGVPAARDSLLLEAGLDWDLLNGTTIGARYNGTIAGTQHSHTVKATFALTF